MTAIGPESNGNCRPIGDISNMEGSCQPSADKRTAANVAGKSPVRREAAGGQQAGTGRRHVAQQGKGTE